MRYKNILLAAAMSTAATGCMNLATKPSEITGSYTSDVKYGGYTCEQLGIEINSLARREDQLVTAQQQRRKSGKVQAFWLGYGTGDGIEASELANVRGEKEAVRRATDKRSCDAQPVGTYAQAETAGRSPSTGPAEIPAAASAHGAGANWRGWAGNSTGATSSHLYRCPGPNGTEVVTEDAAAGCTVIK